MRRFALYAAILLQLLHISHAFLCLINCTPNCADGVSTCDCPGACLNDYLGGCKSNAVCTSTYIEILKSGYPTSTVIYYSTTITSYVGTVTSVVVYTSNYAKVVTSTYIQPVTSTVMATVTAAPVTITKRAAEDNEDWRIGRRAIITTTVIKTIYDPNNYCGQAGFPPCVTTKTAALVYSQYATITSTSIYYNAVNSVVYTTVTTYVYVTSTSTVNGGTVTVTRATTPIPTSYPPTTTPLSTIRTTTTTTSSEPDVTVYNTNTNMVTATATSSPATNQPNVVVTNSRTAIATVTQSSAKKVAEGPRWLMGAYVWICGLVLGQFWFHVR